MALNWVGAFSKPDIVIGKKGIHKPISCDVNTKMIHFSIFPLCGIITTTFDIHKSIIGFPLEKLMPPYL